MWACGEMGWEGVRKRKVELEGRGERGANDGDGGGWEGQGEHQIVQLSTSEEQKESCGAVCETLTASVVEKLTVRQRKGLGWSRVGQDKSQVA